MPRSVPKVASRARRKKVLKLAKGYWGSRHNVWTIAKNHVEKGLSHAYRDRRTKKRNFRALWIIRINAAARINGTTYSRLIDALNKKNITINRKVLADLAMNQPSIFATIVQQAIS
jgi:large subunit ribosomal protein L20